MPMAAVDLWCSFLWQTEIDPIPIQPCDSVKEGPVMEDKPDKMTASGRRLKMLVGFIVAAF
jgi:hypothetical protein